jgi:hypothetical protein
MRRSGFWLILGLLLAGVFGLSSAGPAQAIPRLALCANNVDDDRDGAIDFPAEPGCTSASDGSEADPPGVPACADGVDNDNDFKLDYPDDPGCRSAADTMEGDPVMLPACGDGTDNDVDTKSDYPADRGCIAASDPTEQNTACSDGTDNDGDGRVDFPLDFGCRVPSNAPDQIDNAEVDPPECNDGRDNDNDGTLDADTNIGGQAQDYGCTGPYDTTEAPNPACADRLDNDRDLLTDFPADPGCTSPEDPDETDPPLAPAPPPAPPSASPQCSDLLDNDGDGRFDFPNDAGCASRLDNDESDPPPVAKAVPFDLSGSSAPAPAATSSKIRPPISPFPIVRLRGRVDRGGVFITLLRIQAPRGSKVTVYCGGRGCPLRKRSETTVTGVVRALPFERRLRAGTTLTIYVVKQGFMGKYTRFKIRKGKPPTRIDRCASFTGHPAVSCRVK